MVTRLSDAFKLFFSNPIRKWLFIGGTAYAFFFSQGLPLWDDDFTSIFRKLGDKTLFDLVFEWVSPISTQPQYWGFNERPAQAFLYKLFHSISGYEPWSYYLFKDLAYGGLGVMIYLWALRLVSPSRNGQIAAIAAAVFFLLAPNPMSAHIIHSDLAPLAELWFLVATYFIWDAVEKTPNDWVRFPDHKQPEQMKWMKQWAILSFCTYLGYKAKADLKMIPVILSAYVYLNHERRKQWKLFAFPVGLMLALAVPWGPGIFAKLPPFMPGSTGSEIGWMYRPASIGGTIDFLWSSASIDFMTFVRSAPLSLAGLLGPFLLVPLAGFLFWRMEAIDKVEWTTQERPQDRARTFALCWLAVMLAAISALPALNHSFRIRYTIIPLVPTSLLLAWAFGLFLSSLEANAKKKLPQWALKAAITVVAVQGGMNLYRSIQYRRELGQVMVAVDQVYSHIASQYPGAKIALLPDFRAYDYRPVPIPALDQKEAVASIDDIPKKYQPGNTYLISWQPTLWPQVEQVERFTGCHEGSFFDQLFPCQQGTGAHLMRYIGTDPMYAAGEEQRNRGDVAGALRAHEEFLNRHPNSLAGHFVAGLEAYQLKDWNRALRAYSFLSGYLPEHPSITYNHALVLSETGNPVAAAEKLEKLAKKEPTNFGVAVNLYQAYRKSGQMQKAREFIAKERQVFPGNPLIDRMIAEAN